MIPLHLAQTFVMAERTFTDPDGTEWQVWSVVPGEHSEWPEHARKHLPDAMAEGWLCFESAGEKRRLHPLPPGWDERGDDELRALCTQAVRVDRAKSAA